MSNAVSNATETTSQTTTRRWFVTMQWDDYPEGGSYGTVIECADNEDPEALCRIEMAEARSDEETTAEEYLDNYADDWTTVDCFDLDDFIRRHQRPPAAAAPELLAALTAIVFQVCQGPVLERDACITQARAAIARAGATP